MSVSADFRTYHKSELLYAVAKTATTYDAFTEIKLKKGAKTILGFYELIIDAKPTVGENAMCMIKIDSKDLEIHNVLIACSGLIPDGIAANTTNNHQKTWHPWSPDLSRFDNIDNAGITFSITTITSKAEGVAAGIELVYTDSTNIPEEVKDHFTNGTIETFYDGDFAREVAGVGEGTTYAEWGTGLLDVIRLTSQAKRLVGIYAEAVPNAFTTALGLISIYKFTCSSLTDLEPCEVLIGTGWDAPLGTVIDVPMAGQGRYLPVYKQLGAGVVDVTVADKSGQALTNDAEGLTAWAWN